LTETIKIEELNTVLPLASLEARLLKIKKYAYNIGKSTFQSKKF
jgi:hypothetical protein